MHLKNDCESLKSWRDSIDSVHVKEIYKKRSSTAEFSNMHVKNQALKEFSIRGLVKVKGAAILHAIAQNISRSFDLLKKKTENLRKSTL